MATRFATVDEYIDALPDDVRPLMEGVRRSIHTVVPDIGETISYQMPTFTLDGKPLVHVAAWKKHIGLYPLPAMDDDLDPRRRALPRHEGHAPAAAGRRALRPARTRARRGPPAAPGRNRLVRAARPPRTGPGPLPSAATSTGCGAEHL